MDIDQVLTQSGIKTRAALARVCRVTKQAVAHWRIVPEDRCHFVEAATGLRCEALRPDVQWVRDSAGMVTGYTVQVEQAA